MWVWPQLVFGGSPPHPPLQLEGPSLKPKPFPPRPLPPSSPYMREIGTNVANWRSHRETVHFFGPKWVIFGVLTLQK